MTTATISAVAAELRRLAEALDLASNPDAEIPCPLVSFFADTKEAFISVAKHLPRPLTKRREYEDTTYPNFVIEYQTPAIWTRAIVPASLTCTLVRPAQPAVYDCDPVLSEEEETETTA